MFFNIIRVCRVVLGKINIVSQRLILFFLSTSRTYIRENINNNNIEYRHTHNNATTMAQGAQIHRVPGER